MTPRFALSIYILALSLWLLDWFYLTNLYYEAMVKHGVYNDGSSAMLLGVGQVMAIPALPAIGLILFLILRNYPGRVSLLAWNGQKKWLSIFWTVLFLPIIASSIAEAYRMLTIGSPPNVFSCLVYVYLYLVFRAVLVEKTKHLFKKKLVSNDSECVVCQNCCLEQWKGHDICQKCGNRLTEN
jgi:hypothetical protein